jgi:hypothetical protein
MNLSHTIFVLVSTILFTAACSPEPVFRLQADQDGENERVTYQGVEYLISEKDSSEAVLAYYRHIDGRVIFDLQVTNFSNREFHFSPNNIEFKSYSLDYSYDTDLDEVIASRKAISEGEAIDPEEVLLNLDLASSRTEARNRTNNVLEGIGGTLTAIDDISSASRYESAEQRTWRETRRTRQAAERAERRERYYRDVASLNDSRAYWEAEVLRKTDLPSGTSVAGEISFPEARDADIIEVTIGFLEDEHRFLFRQLRYEP